MQLLLKFRPVSSSKCQTEYLFISIVCKQHSVPEKQVLNYKCFDTMQICDVLSCKSIIVACVQPTSSPQKKEKTWRRGVCDSSLLIVYSHTSLIRTPKGQNQVSTLQRCLYYRGKECMIFGISGTKQTVHNREVSVLQRCLEGGVRLYGTNFA